MLDLDLCRQVASHDRWADVFGSGPAEEKCLRRPCGYLVGIASGKWAAIGLGPSKARASVNASPAMSPAPAHDSRSGWFATPFLWGSFIPDFPPVYPGAFALPLNVLKSLSLKGPDSRYEPLVAWRGLRRPRQALSTSLLEGRRRHTFFSNTSLRWSYQISGSRETTGPKLAQLSCDIHVRLGHQTKSRVARPVCLKVGYPLDSGDPKM